MNLHSSTKSGRITGGVESVNEPNTGFGGGNGVGRVASHTRTVSGWKGYRVNGDVNDLCSMHEPRRRSAVVKTGRNGPLTVRSGGMAGRTIASRRTPGCRELRRRSSAAFSGRQPSCSNFGGSGEHKGGGGYRVGLSFRRGAAEKAPIVTSGGTTRSAGHGSSSEG